MEVKSGSLNSGLLESELSMSTLEENVVAVESGESEVKDEVVPKEETVVALLLSILAHTATKVGNNPCPHVSMWSACEAVDVKKQLFTSTGQEFLAPKGQEINSVNYIWYL
ncbi:hypothetical protein Fot_02759 [Forsythia ovata]|uniref:Uncharacterized protein n=1 Tax=Forsythia ovata TaxID=205694 RepID=A0ABD1XBS0_9LAMI